MTNRRPISVGISGGHSAALSGFPSEGVWLVAGPLNKQEEVVLRLVSLLALRCHWTAALPVLWQNIVACLCYIMVQLLQMYSKHFLQRVQSTRGQLLRSLGGDFLILPTAFLCANGLLAFWWSSRIYFSCLKPLIERVTLLLEFWSLGIFHLAFRDLREKVNRSEGWFGLHLHGRAGRSVKRLPLRGRSGIDLGSWNRHKDFLYLHRYGGGTSDSFLAFFSPWG